MLLAMPQGSDGTAGRALITGRFWAQHFRPLCNQLETASNLQQPLTNLWCNTHFNLIANGCLVGRCLQPCVNEAQAIKFTLTSSNRPPTGERTFYLVFYRRLPDGC